jgi:hypothetical protein
VARIIRPAIEKWGNAQHEEKIVWKGLYALRRTAASLLWSLTGDTQASQQVLRHSSPSTTVRHYLVADRSKMLLGLKLLEAKIGERERGPAYLILGGSSAANQSVILSMTSPLANFSRRSSHFPLSRKAGLLASAAPDRIVSTDPAMPCR